MIASGDQRVLISSMGWVEKDALWVFDVASRKENRVTLYSGARYLSLHCCDPSCFAVQHHFDGSHFEVTIHRFAEPGRVIARGVFGSDSSRLEGDLEIWRLVPRLYVEYLGFEPWHDFTLLRVSAATSRIEAQRLDWYDATYDKGYQGVIGIIEVPGNLAIIAVQRSSQLILHDLVTGKAKGKIDLAGRGGNPRLFVRQKARELWASDYDSLVVVNADNWKAIRNVRLQGALTGTQQFIGDFAFDQNEQVCAVARPFSGDIVGVNPARMKVVSRAKVGDQPLEVEVLDGDQVVARDWKTGKLLHGELAPRRWWLHFLLP